MNIRNCNGINECSSNLRVKGDHSSRQSVNLIIQADIFTPAAKPNRTSEANKPRGRFPEERLTKAERERAMEGYDEILENGLMQRGADSSILLMRERRKNIQSRLNDKQYRHRTPVLFYNLLIIVEYVSQLPFDDNYLHIQ